MVDDSSCSTQSKQFKTLSRDFQKSSCDSFMTSQANSLGFARAFFLVSSHSSTTMVMVAVSRAGTTRKLRFIPTFVRRGTLVLSILSSTSLASRMSSKTTTCWTWEDPEAFSAISHPGYSTESLPDSFLGGWLAHRVQSNDQDWIQQDISSMITKFDYSKMPIGRPPKILVLYGSLRETSFSRKLAYEFARLLDQTLDCDVRVYNPRGLPVRDPVLEDHPKVQELRALTQWSDGHVWVSPEMHGTVTGVFKNQIDWIPLNTGSVRPTQGKTCLVAQVNGGSQSFNAVNNLRLLARWMRMPCCTNQSSVAKAWKEFDDEGRMKDSSFRERVVDCAEEFAKFTAVMAPVADDLTDRYSERKEKLKEGKLLTQEQKEAKADVNKALT